MRLIGSLYIRILYGASEAGEVSKKLPGARGVVVIQYGPMASHGDHARGRNDSILQALGSQPDGLSVLDQ